MKLEDIKELFNKITLNEALYTGIVPALYATEALVTDARLKELKEVEFEEYISQLGDLYDK